MKLNPITLAVAGALYMLAGGWLGTGTSNQEVHMISAALIGAGAVCMAIAAAAIESK